jgi:hypothetical protein
MKHKTLGFFSTFLWFVWERDLRLIVILVSAAAVTEHKVMGEYTRWRITFSEYFSYPHDCWVLVNISLRVPIWS